MSCGMIVLYHLQHRSHTTYKLNAINLPYTITPSYQLSSRPVPSLSRLAQQSLQSAYDTSKAALPQSSRFPIFKRRQAPTVISSIFGFRPKIKRLQSFALPSLRSSAITSLFSQFYEQLQKRVTLLRFYIPHSSKFCFPWNSKHNMA